MHRRLPFGLLVAAVFGLGLACATADTDGAGFAATGPAGPILGSGPGLPRAAGAAAPSERFLRLAGKKPGGLGFIQTTPDTWGPFDVAITTGFLDPSRMQSPLGVRVCLEIDNVGFSAFYDVCGLFGGAGWTVTAFTHLGGLAGNAQIAGNELELRVEQTGGDVNFYARAAGAMAWTSVATTAFPAQGEPLKAAFGATGLSKGTDVGFDQLVYASSGPPAMPAPAVAVAADVNAALLAGYAAYEDIDGPSPDFASAGAHLDDAADALADAAAGVAALAASKAVSSAAKHIAKAAKGLPKAQDQVDGQDAKKGMKSLEKMGRSLIEAALLLNPQPLP